MLGVATAVLTACTRSPSKPITSEVTSGSAPAFGNPSDRLLGAAATNLSNAISIEAVEGPVAVEIVCSLGDGPRADVNLGGETVSYPCDGRAFVTEFTPDKPADHVSVHVTAKTPYDIRVVER